MTPMTVSSQGSGSSGRRTADATAGRPAARRRSVAERVMRDARPRVASCVVVSDGCWVFDVVTSPDSVCLSVCLSCLVKR